MAKRSTHGNRRKKQPLARDLFTVCSCVGRLESPTLENKNLGESMLRFVHSDLFRSPAQTLVNTVNTVGVMGKGIAKEFRSQYPAMYREYKGFCDAGQLTIGSLHIWRTSGRWILNFPTKTTWRRPSHIKYIEQGLHTFRANYTRLGIRSIAFPPLGCGNGELDWREVKPLMVQYLHNLDIPVWIHEMFYTERFKPEQKEALASVPPETFEEFVRDIRSTIIDHHGRFVDWLTNTPFIADANGDGCLNVFVNSKITIDEDFLAMAWVGLRLGIVTTEYFGPHQKSPGAFILPILATLPYVKPIKFESAEKKGLLSERSGLMFRQDVENYAKKHLGSLL